MTVSLRNGLHYSNIKVSFINTLSDPNDVNDVKSSCLKIRGRNVGE